MDPMRVLPRRVGVAVATLMALLSISGVHTQQQLQPIAYIQAVPFHVTQSPAALLQPGGGHEPRASRPMQSGCVLGVDAAISSATRVATRLRLFAHRVGPDLGVAACAHESSAAPRAPPA